MPELKLCFYGQLRVDVKHYYVGLLKMTRWYFIGPAM